MSMRGMFVKVIQPRLSTSVGESILYSILQFLLKPIKLIDDEVHPKTFWKLNHSRWVQFWEPILFIGLGYWIMQEGYEVYGQFLMWCAACVGFLTFQAHNNSAKRGQGHRDAKYVAEMAKAQQAQKKEEQEPHVIQ